MIQALLKIVILLWIVPRIVFAQADTVIFTQPPSLTEILNIESYTGYFEDTTNQLGLAEVKKQSFRPLLERNNDRVTGLTRSTKTTWLRFTVTNRMNDTLKLLQYCFLHGRIDVYEEDEMIATYGFVYQESGRYPKPLNVPPHATRHYLIKVVNYMHSVLPLTSLLFSEAAFFKTSFEESKTTMPLLVFLSVMAGCFLFMILFACYHYYLIRDRAFLFYGLSVVMIFHVSLVGLSNRFGVFDLKNFSVLPLYFILYMFFIDQMIGVKKTYSKFWRIIVITMVSLAGMQIINVVHYRLSFIP